MKAKTRRVNKEFIEKELIPFVLREQGRGFEMTFWRRSLAGDKYDSYDLDGASIDSPVCRTVACLGGSVSVITGVSGVAEIGRFLGLTPEEADGLFSYWRPISKTHYRWPLAYALKFTKAQTKLEKAKTAVALLRHIIKTDAKCLRARNFEVENNV